MWMGPRAFTYYLSSAVEAIQKDLLLKEGAAVPWLCCYVENQIKHYPEIIPAVRNDIRTFCKVASANWQPGNFALEEELEIPTKIQTLLDKILESAA